ncbi:MAG: EAL domain-containing protein, partial [Acidobacteriota bacterium]
TISVNLSCRQFDDPELTRLIRDVLANTGLPAGVLRLEVTESIFAKDPEAAQAILSDLAALGVGLEIDDFGTGYSSLSQLHRLPFDTLKVDHSFVRAMDRSPEGRKIVDSIANLARSLGIGVVAEGIEKAEHWVQLENLGCHVGQGYFFGIPAGADATTELIRQRCTEKWAKPDGAGMFMSNLIAIEEAAASGGEAKGSTSHEKDWT